MTIASVSRWLTTIAVVLAGALPGQPPAATVLGSDDSGVGFSAWAVRAPGSVPIALRPSALPALQALLIDQPAHSPLWVTGNPVFAVTDLTRPFMIAAARTSTEEGAYRSPFEARNITLRSVALLGGRADVRSGAVGRVVVADRRLDGTTEMITLEPHRAGPYRTLLDSAVPVAHSVVMMDAAAAIRRGRLMLGVAPSYDAAIGRGALLGIARTGRRAAIGGRIGLGLAGLPGATVLGAHLGVGSFLEIDRVTPTFQRIVLWRLRGYSEPDSIITDRVPFHGRREGTGRSAGLSAHGALRRTRWIVWSEVFEDDERQTSVERADPPSERWELGGWRASGGASARFSGLELNALGSITRADGEGTHPDIADVAHVARLESIDASVHASFSFRSRTRLIASVRAAQNRWVRRDRIAALHSDIESYTLAAAALAQREFTSRLRLSAGYSVARYDASSEIPAGDSLGPVFRKFVAPELELRTSPALAHAIGSEVGWTTGKHGRTWLRFTRDLTYSRGGLAFTPFRPSGRRLRHAVTMGFTRSICSDCPGAGAPEVKSSGGG